MVYLKHTAGSRQYASNIWYKFNELIRKMKKKLNCIHHRVLGVYIMAIKNNIVFSIKINYQSFQFLYSTISNRYNVTDVPLPPLCIQHSNDRTINAVQREGTELCLLYYMATGHNDGTY